MSKEYDDYLDGHIGSVQKAARWMMKNLGAFRELTIKNQNAFARCANIHDNSKFGAVEYAPYDNYFYGEKDEAAFNIAWLHHIHNNPHHWQHWLLFEDENDGKPKPLEMPKVYALEMVADWWSFSWRSGNLREVFRWYDEHKGRIILHHDTRKYVESVLGEIGEKLDAADDSAHGEGES